MMELGSSRTWMIAVAIAALCGCMPVGMTALGVGGNTAVSHTLTGITYRTFTAPSSKVKNAILVALDRMEIKLVSTEMDRHIEIIHARTSERAIEIQVDPISHNTTRMRVTARSNGFLFDSATATEIIIQTERAMESETPPGGPGQMLNPSNNLTELPI